LAQRLPPVAIGLDLLDGSMMHGYLDDVGDHPDSTQGAVILGGGEMMRCVSIAAVTLLGDDPIDQSDELLGE